MIDENLGRHYFFIYDFRNRPTVVYLPDKEIKEIWVSVFSGDETGTVTFVDGTEQKFDASPERDLDYNDGAYLLTEKEEIEKWMNWCVFSADDKAAYQRYEAFAGQDICEDELFKKSAEELVNEIFGIIEGRLAEGKDSALLEFFKDLAEEEEEREENEPQ